MSDFANWFKKHENRSGSKEMWFLKGLIDGQIEPGHAAKSLTMKINLKNTRDLYEISQTILSLALHSLDSAVQEKLVELTSELRILRICSMGLKKGIRLPGVLGEMEEIIGDTWACGYLISSFYSAFECRMLNIHKFSSSLGW